MLAPVLEELAVEYDGKVKFTKTDAHENSSVSVELGIMALPSLVLFKDGQEVDRIVGAKPKAQLKDWIDSKVGG